VYEETECKGMGCTSCRLVGRPLEETEAPAKGHRFYRPAPQVNRFGAGATATQTAGATGPQPDVIGISSGFRTALHYLTKAAPSKATLLFLGETGVGKEVFARLAHSMSPRRAAPFVAVNCGALPENLIEAELFGVVRGAYTGAHASRPGRFERAEGGTLFLDEVSTLSPAAQVKLLRALQEHEIERVGDVNTRRVDVRVMAAANVDLREAVRRKEFREDLYFRLATFPIRIPPLRERRDDIPLLMEHFRTRYCAAHGKRSPGFTAQAVEALLSAELPGNIRELEHRIERAVLLAEDDQPLDLAHLFQGEDRDDTRMLGLDPAGNLRRLHSADLRRRVEELVQAVDDQGNGFDTLEREILEAAVSQARGNLAAAARRLGLTRRKVAMRLERLRTAHGDS
jgi:two-component system, NtrC family, response regulator HydG